MARAPFQVLVLPYRRRAGAQLEYAIFRRADDDAWQGVAGGGEDDETPREAAAREMREETGIMSARLVQLDVVGTISVEHFDARGRWDPSVREVPEYAFGVEVDGVEISLSTEHRQIAWLTFEDAMARLRWQSNRNALSELHSRLSVAGDADRA